MKNKLMRYAMFYIAEWMEEYNEAIENLEYTDVNHFMEDQHIKVETACWQDGNRVDAKVIITQYGELEAQFEMNVAR